MKKAILLPLGDSAHMAKLTDELGVLVDQGREREFAVLLPTSHLLHQFRHRLVKRAARRLNLTTFDELVAESLENADLENSLDANGIAEVVRDILVGQGFSLGKTNARSMAQALAYTIGQLRRAGISQGDLAVAARTDAVLGELVQVWQQYDHFLATKNLADLEQQYILAREHLAKLTWLKDVKQLHICWFFDFEHLQRGILEALAEIIPSITLWMPFAHPAHQGYIHRTLDSLAQLGFELKSQSGDSGRHLVENLFIAPPVARQARVSGFAAPRLKQELELVAREIKKLARSGVAPGEIGLVVPDQRKYLPLMRQVFREHQIDLSMPLVTELNSVPWLKELLDLWRGTGAGWDRESLLNVAANTYITAHLPKDYDGDVMAWALHSLAGNLRGKQWLERLDREIGTLEGQLARCTDEYFKKDLHKSLDLYARARPGIEAWIEMGSRIRNMPIQQHCEMLVDIAAENLERVCPVADDQDDLRDRLAWSMLNTVIRSFQNCLALLDKDGIVSPNQFIEDITQWLEQDISLERSSPGAIRVLAPAQVRGLDCSYMFILGMNQGVFPRPVREHWLLDRIAGLPGLEMGNSLEQEKIFFHCCVATARQGLYLSRQLPGADQEAELSSFWRDIDSIVQGGLAVVEAGSELLPELALTTSRRQLRERLVYDLSLGKLDPKKVPWLPSEPEYRDLVSASWCEQRRESPVPPDNYDGDLAASGDYLNSRFGRGIYSITRLEQYIKCPFAFYARHVLGLEASPQHSYSHLERGTLLHWLLEQFYTRFLDQADAARPVTIKNPLEALAQQWLRESGRSDEIWKLRVQDAVNMALPLIMTDLAWLKRTGLRPVLFEAKFGLPGGETGPLRPGQGEVSFHGKIDRVDILEQDGETWAIVYDYKTSSAITKVDILRGKSLQIPVYLAAVPQLLKARGYENIRVMGGGYYNIQEAKLAGGIWHKQFATLVKSGLSSLDDQEFTQLEHDLAENSQRLHNKIMAGKFSPNPDGSACRWCDFATLCRYDKNRFRLKKGGDEDATQCGTSSCNGD